MHRKILASIALRRLLQPEHDAPVILKYILKNIPGFNGRDS